MRLCEPEAQRGANGQPLQRSPDSKPPMVNIETKEWQVFLSRERDKKLGLDVDPRQREHLLVLSIEEGTVQEYNTKNPENAVQEGDHIVSVNGSSQDTEMVISADFIGSRKLHSCVLLRIKENGCPSWKIDRSDKRPWA